MYSKNNNQKWWDLSKPVINTFKFNFLQLFQFSHSFLATTERFNFAGIKILPGEKWFMVSITTAPKGLNLKFRSKVNPGFTNYQLFALCFSKSFIRF